MSERDNPEVVYEKLKKEAKTKTAKTLSAIHQMCKEQFERGSVDFTVATIGKLSDAAGGISAQSIRNPSGKVYKTLINAWAKHKSPPKNTAKQLKPKDAWVEGIEDSTHQWLVRDLLAENSRLKGEVQQLKAIKTLEIDMRPQPVEQNKAFEFKPTTLTETEIKALKHAIDEVQLEDKGWVVTSRGAIEAPIKVCAPGHIGEPSEATDDNGDPMTRQLFKNGFVTAIKKLLAV
jgi:hypothetical protein